MDEVTKCMKRICNSEKALPRDKAYMNNDLEEIARVVRGMSALIERMETKWSQPEPGAGGPTYQEDCGGLTKARH
jgi:hypothetical protein